MGRTGTVVRVVEHAGEVAVTFGPQRRWVWFRLSQLVLVPDERRHSAHTLPIGTTPVRCTRESRSPLVQHGPSGVHLALLVPD